MAISTRLVRRDSKAARAAIEEKTSKNKKIVDNQSLIPDRLALLIQKQDCRASEDVKSNVDLIIEDCLQIKRDSELIIADYKDVVQEFKDRDYIEAIKSIEEILRNSEDILREAEDVKQHSTNLALIWKGTGILIPAGLLVMKLLHLR